MSDQPSTAELKEIILHLLAKDRVHEARWRVLAATCEAALKSLGARLPPNQTIFEAMAPHIREDLEKTLIELETAHPAHAAMLSQLIEQMYPDKI